MKYQNFLVIIYFLFLTTPLRAAHWDWLTQKEFPNAIKNLSIETLDQAVFLALELAKEKHSLPEKLNIPTLDRDSTFFGQNKTQEILGIGLTRTLEIKLDGGVSLHVFGIIGWHMYAPQSSSSKIKSKTPEALLKLESLSVEIRYVFQSQEPLSLVSNEEFLGALKNNRAASLLFDPRGDVPKGIALEAKNALPKTLLTTNCYHVFLAYPGPAQHRTETPTSCMDFETE